ncbi:MAG: ParB/RepB/Spo0J family partition protein [Thaumarchaeota archaeon]|nr:ParB/RepB/Spo0J family partition protein [Nitrososphaerota archaeon]
MDIFDNSLVEPIELRMIRPSQSPVRYPDSKNSTDLDNLKLSIKEHGLLQPIVVRPLEHGFEIVAGHRRFAACKSLRWRFIPCKIREFSDKHAYEIQLTENLQRKTMDPIEEAEAFQKYIVDFGWGGVSDLGKKIGKSEEYVSHRIQLLRLPEDVKDKVTCSDLSVSQALEITTVDPSIKADLASNIVDNNLTVRQIRQIKHQLKPKENDIDSHSKSKGDQIIRKSSLALKITLSRIDDLIEDAHSTNAKERVELITFLMDVRRKVHTMIDDSLKYKKRQSSGR